MGSSKFFPIIFENLNTPWEGIADRAVRLTLPAKGIISSEMSNPLGLYYIIDGFVRLSFLSYDGQERILMYCGKGVIFNEIPSFIGAADYLFTCIETTKAYYWAPGLIDKEFVTENPLLILNLLKSLCTKAGSFCAKLYSSSFSDIFTNTCRALYSMHLYNNKSGKIVPRLSQQELAAMLGVHRSSLHKALKLLQSEGIIGDYSRKRLDIYNPNALLHYT